MSKINEPFQNNDEKRHEKRSRHHYVIIPERVRAPKWTQDHCNLEIGFSDLKFDYLLKAHSNSLKSRLFVLRNCFGH